MEKEMTTLFLLAIIAVLTYLLWDLTSNRGIPILAAIAASAATAFDLVYAWFMGLF